MATKLNMAKEALKTNQDAKKAQDASVVLTMNDVPIGVRVKEAHIAREKTQKANGILEQVEKSLEKDSSKKDKYQTLIQENNEYLEATRHINDRK